jgi:hypothetical protein
MWFERKREPVNEEAPQHWPTERMIAGGHADYATPGDLEELDAQTLESISQICAVPVVAPDECIPCLAYVKWLEMVKVQFEDVAPQVPDFEPAAEPSEVDAGWPNPQDDLPDAPWEPPGGPARHADPVREIARQAKYLQDLVDEMLDGPPIPPRDVSLDELALLTVAAQRWVKITDAQGVDLSSDQQAMLDATRALVARLHRG